MPWLISAMKLSVMSLGTRSLLYISSKHEYSSAAIRRNYVRIPGSE
jgi:hypothetical protein